MQITCVLLLSDNMTDNAKQRKPGRPRTIAREGGKPRKVSLFLTAKQYAKLKQRAEKQNTTVSELLRQAAA